MPTLFSLLSFTISLGCRQQILHLTVDLHDSPPCFYNNSVQNLVSSLSRAPTMFRLVHDLETSSNRNSKQIFVSGTSFAQTCHALTLYTIYG